MSVLKSLWLLLAAVLDYVSRVAIINHTLVDGPESIWVMKTIEDKLYLIR